MTPAPDADISLGSALAAGAKCGIKLCTRKLICLKQSIAIYILPTYIVPENILQNILYQVLVEAKCGLILCTRK